MKPNIKPGATHFIVLYDVPCVSGRDRTRRIDHCSSGVREIIYFAPFFQCVKNEIVATFFITPKNNAI